MKIGLSQQIATLLNRLNTRVGFMFSPLLSRKPLCSSHIKERLCQENSIQLSTKLDP